MRNYLSRGLRPKIGEIPHIGSESLPPNGSNGQEMGRDGIIKSSLIAMVSLEYPADRNGPPPRVPQWGMGQTSKWEYHAHGSPWPFMIDRALTFQYGSGTLRRELQKGLQKRRKRKREDEKTAKLRREQMRRKRKTKEGEKCKSIIVYAE